MAAAGEASADAGNARRRFHNYGSTVELLLLNFIGEKCLPADWVLVRGWNEGSCDAALVYIPPGHPAASCASSLEFLLKILETADAECCNEGKDSYSDLLDVIKHQNGGETSSGKLKILPFDIKAATGNKHQTRKGANLNQGAEFFLIVFGDNPNYVAVMPREIYHSWDYWRLRESLPWTVHQTDLKPLIKDLLQLASSAPRPRTARLLNPTNGSSMYGWDVSLSTFQYLFPPADPVGSEEAHSPHHISIRQIAKLSRILRLGGFYRAIDVLNTGSEPFGGDILFGLNAISLAEDVRVQHKVSKNFADLGKHLPLPQNRWHFCFIQNSASDDFWCSARQDMDIQRTGIWKTRLIGDKASYFHRTLPATDNERGCREFAKQLEKYMRDRAQGAIAKEKQDLIAKPGRALGELGRKVGKTTRPPMIPGLRERKREEDAAYLVRLCNVVAQRQGQNLFFRLPRRCSIGDAIVIQHEWSDQQATSNEVLSLIFEMFRDHERLCIPMWILSDARCGKKSKVSRYQFGSNNYPLLKVGGDLLRPRQGFEGPSVLVSLMPSSADEREGRVWQDVVLMPTHSTAMFQQGDFSPVMKRIALVLPAVEGSFIAAGFDPRTHVLSINDGSLNNHLDRIFKNPQVRIDNYSGNLMNPEFATNRCTLDLRSLVQCLFFESIPVDKEDVQQILPPAGKINWSAFLDHVTDNSGGGLSAPQTGGGKKKTSRKIKLPRREEKYDGPRLDDDEEQENNEGDEEEEDYDDDDDEEEEEEEKEEEEDSVE